MSNTTPAAATPAVAYHLEGGLQEVGVLLIHSAFARNEVTERQCAPGRQMIYVDPRNFGAKEVPSIETLLHMVFEATNRPGATYRKSISQGRCYTLSAGDYIRVRIQDDANGPAHAFFLVARHGFTQLTLAEFEAVEAARIADGTRFFCPEEAIENLRNPKLATA